MPVKVELELSDEILDTIASKVHQKNLEDKPKIEDPKQEKTYTVQEVADRLNRDACTIRRHINNDLLKATKQGKSWIITETNLNLYINGK